MFQLLLSNYSLHWKWIAMLLKALSIVMDFKQLKQNEVDIPFVPGEVAAAAASLWWWNSGSTWSAPVLELQLSQGLEEQTSNVWILSINV